jgi:uncharacterized phiE125 gp8 family phage protein
MSLTRIEAPDVDPVTVEELKGHLRVTSTSEDDEIESFIKAATGKLDGADGSLGRALITQTWELTLDAFPRREVSLPLPPLQSVVSIKYDDVTGVEQTLAVENYKVDNRSQPGWVLPVGSWPPTYSGINAVRITFIAGYGDNGDDVPEPLRQAIRLWAGHLYENREAVITASGFMREIELGVEDHIRDYRLWRF